MQFFVIDLIIFDIRVLFVLVYYQRFVVYSYFFQIRLLLKDPKGPTLRFGRENMLIQRSLDREYLRIYLSSVSVV